VWFAIGVVASLAVAAQGAALTNGTFESLSADPDATGNTATFTGWSEQKTTSDSTLQNAAKTNGVGGGLTTSPNGNATGNGAVIIPGGGILVQNQNTASTWQFDVDFAMVDPGDSSTRGLNVFLWHDTSALKGINLRVNGDGTVQVFTTTWVTLSSLTGKVSFSTDANSDGLLNTSGGSGDTVAVNHLTITGNYTGSPTYSVSVTNASGSTFTQTGISSFNNNYAPSAGGMLKKYAFVGSYSGLYVVDNAAIPEPATLSLLGIGGLLWTLRRRRGAC